MKSRKIVWGAAALFIAAASSFGIVSAQASGPGNAACAVTDGSVTTNQPITAAQGSNGGTFSSTTITCQGTDADDNGSWTGISATFSENAGDVPGNCAGENGTGSFTGGKAPNGAAGDGTVTGGTFSFTRVATHVHVTGHLNTKDASGGTESHAFTAELEFTPNPATQTCATGGITTANLQGAAAISE